MYVDYVLRLHMYIHVCRLCIRITHVCRVDYVCSLHMYKYIYDSNYTWELLDLNQSKAIQQT